jgi:hypothetical protein
MELAGRLSAGLCASFREYNWTESAAQVRSCRQSKTFSPPAEAAAKPPPTALRLEAVKKNADILVLTWLKSADCFVSPVR